ncbi:MAG: DEAD/DEAH box helicase, partial [Pseudarthrobacter sp.]
MSSISGPLSPSESYRASREHTAEARTYLGGFVRTLDFELDEFQRLACQSLQEGRGVLVAAPTGAGKTIVGEFAIYLALERHLKAFYTTPIKALSNQKFSELAEKYGAENVGLLTGDTSINGDAPVVVMTTEVLRNMLYADSATLDDLGFVVMDEVHYLADRFRGAVWEEVIIHLPSEVQVVSLSATVSNAEEFGAWLDTVRGDTDIIVSEHRPVPLWQHVMVGREIVDLFAGETTFDEIAPPADAETGAPLPVREGLEPGRDSATRDGAAGRGFEVNPDLLAMARSESQESFRGRFGHSGRSQRRQHKQRSDARPAQGAQPGAVRRASRPQVIASLDRQ